VVPEFFLLSLIIQGVAGTLLKHKQGDSRHQNLCQGIVGFLPTVLQLSQLVKQVGKKMMDGLEQFVEDRLPTARLGRGGSPPGTMLGLTLRRVACFPVLTALTENKRAFLHQGLR
jgi:hypothetical protein